MPDRAYPTRSRRAIALSLAIHLGVLGLLALRLAGHGWYDASFGDVPVHISTLTITHRAAPPKAQRAVLAAAAPKAVPAARPRREQTILRDTPAPYTEHNVGGDNPKHVTTVVAASKPHETALLAAPADAPVVRVTLTAPAVTASPEPSATPSPEASTGGSSVALDRGSGGVPGGFGQNQKAAFYQEASLTPIRARLTKRDLVRIRVDETGHAIDVQFVRFAGDEAARNDVRDALLQMRYLPAECDGMRCEGSFEIRV